VVDDIIRKKEALAEVIVNIVLGGSKGIGGMMAQRSKLTQVNAFTRQSRLNSL